MKEKEAENRKRQKEREAAHAAEVKTLTEELLKKQRDVEFIDAKFKELESRLATSAKNEKLLLQRLNESEAAYNA